MYFLPFEVYKQIKNKNDEVLLKRMELRREKIRSSIMKIQPLRRGEITNEKIRLPEAVCNIIMEKVLDSELKPVITGNSMWY